MALYDIFLLLLIEFRLHFHFVYASIVQVCIYSSVPSLNDLVNVTINQVSDLNFLDLSWLIIKVHYLTIGFGLPDNQDMLVVSMQGFNLCRRVQKMSLVWTGWVFK